jgi:capsular polysaccharide biosynthesis protein
MELEALKLIKGILRRWPVVIAAAVICALSVFIVSNNFLTPLYESYVTMYIENTRDYDGYISSGDLASSQDLLDTYVVLLNSNSVLEKVIEKSGLDISAGELEGMIDESAVNNTQVLRVAVRSEDPAVALKLAQSIGEVVPSEIIRIVKAGNVEIVDKAQLPYEPFFPNVASLTFFGAVAGFFLSCLGIALKDILDTRIKSEEDIVQSTSLPVIGLIPIFETGRKFGRN